jgi:hypothetical protein
MIDSKNSEDNNAVMTESTELLTLTDIEEATKKWDFAFNARTFWKYYRLGLLPKGKKIRGRGNVMYFPSETPKRLFAVHWMSTVMGIPLAEIRRITKGKCENLTPVDIAALMAMAIADLHLADKRLTRDDLEQIGNSLKEQCKRLQIEL